MSNPEVDLKRIEESLKKPIQTSPPLKAHDLARRLLALPDGDVILVKGEGGGYVSECAVSPGGPWHAFGSVRLQVQHVENGVAATAPAKIA